MAMTSIERLLSVDLGRTATKTCINQEPADVVVIPANVKRLYVEEVRRGFDEMDVGDPLLDLWLDYKGQGYALGQLAADFGADLGLGEQKFENALVKIFASIGYFKLWGQSLGIVLGLPFMSQQQFDQEKSELGNALLGDHAMTFRGDSVRCHIEQVWVMPEGYGSLLRSEAQNSDNAGDQSFVNASVAVMDVGYQTTDFLLFDRFRFARGASNSEDFAMSEFYARLAGRIPGANSQSLALIEAVNQPEGQRFYRPKGGAMATDLDTLLPELRSDFARELYDLLIQWLPERTRDIIVTGGGGGFFWENLRSLIRTSNLVPHLATPPRQANALGQYMYSELRLNAARKEETSE